jgi:hypothetical protein
MNYFFKGNNYSQNAFKDVKHLFAVIPVSSHEHLWSHK